MRSKIVPAALFALLSAAIAVPSFAQNYPFPSKVGELPIIICTACKSLNSAGQPNVGKPTWPYDDPLVAFAGRMVDSQATPNIQNLGMRTLRAGIVRTAYTQRGAAPPTVYVYIGLATLGAYRLDSFPPGRRSPMVPVSSLASTRVGLRKDGPEKVARPNAFVYPEAPRSGWQVPFVDSIERLKDFDFDDRGYVYIAYDVFGFGIVRDPGQSGTGTGTLQLVAGSQQIESLGDIQPDKIIAVKTSDGRYYAAVSYSSNSNAGLRIFDVTNPARPSLTVHTTGPATRQTVIRDWARDDGKRIVAVVANDGVLRIYTYDAFARNAPPVHSKTSTTRFLSMAFDEGGALWVAEAPRDKKGKAQVRRLVFTADGRLVETLFQPFPETFEAIKMHVRNGYLAAVGKVQRGKNTRPNGFLFRIENPGGGVATKLTNLDTRDFFLKYYHAAPSGFAQPAGYTSSPQDIHILTTGGKTYLMYMVYGLGDVYEISGEGRGAVTQPPAASPPRP